MRLQQAITKPHLIGVELWNLIEISVQLLMLPEILSQILLIDVFHLPTQKNFQLSCAAARRHTKIVKISLSSGLSRSP